MIKKHDKKHDKKVNDKKHDKKVVKKEDKCSIPLKKNNREIKRIQLSSSKS